MKMWKLFYIAAVAMTCTFCQPEKGRRYIGPVYYDLWLSFQDAEGNDLVEGINGTGSAGSTEGDYVDPEVYSLESSPNLHELGYGPRPGFIPDDPHPYPRLLLVYPNPNATDHYNLVFEIATPQKLAPKTITYTLTCPHVFGDDAAHEIITYWKKPSDWDKNADIDRTCYLVEVDGKEMSDISHPWGEALTLATIVLDR